MADVLVKLQDAIADFNDHYSRHKKGNKSAAIRARKSLLSIRNICTEGRAEIQAESTKDAENNAA